MPYSLGTLPRADTRDCPAKRTNSRLGIPWQESRSWPTRSAVSFEMPNVWCYGKLSFSRVASSGR